MEEIVQFLLAHWALSSLFVILLALFIVNELRNSSVGQRGISPAELVGMMNHDRAVVVDIRDKSAFEQGHILGAIHLEQSEFNNKKNSLNKYKSRPIVLVCESGANAPKIMTLLQDQGFTQTFTLKGGLQNWRADNMPMTKG